MPISLVLDIIISVLLVLTIAYAMRLNQRLSQLRSDKNELMKLAKTFADATTRAESGIQNLKSASDELRLEITRAMALKDDLSYLVDRGDRSADDMVANVRMPARAPGRTQAPSTGVGLGSALSGGKTRRGGSSSERGSSSDTRLIEDAIRAASSENEESNKAFNKSRDDRATMTRRIAGHPGGSSVASSAPAAAYAGKAPGALATRGMGQGSDRGAVRRNENEDAIEDSESARELLKALSAVK